MTYCRRAETWDYFVVEMLYCYFKVIQVLTLVTPTQKKMRKSQRLNNCNITTACLRSTRMTGAHALLSMCYYESYEYYGTLYNIKHN